MKHYFFVEILETGNGFSTNDLGELCEFAKTYPGAFRVGLQIIDEGGQEVFATEWTINK